MTASDHGHDRAKAPVRPGSILRAMQNGADESPRANLPSLDEPQAAAPRATATAGAEPKLEVVRADGRVQKIVATCGCGERIVIHCDYDPTLETPPPGGTP